MQTIKWFSFLLILGFSCSKSTSDPNPLPNDNARARLNDQAWPAFAKASRSSTQNDSCATNTFYLSIENNLPYPKRARVQAIESCAGYCGDQSLSFSRIPLAVGTYPVSAAQPCQVAIKVGVSYATLIGGDVLRDLYQPQPANAGVIKITKYNAASGELSGTFEVTLIRDARWNATPDAAETVRFRDGSFTVKLQ